MPQFDPSSFSSQIFWLIICFSALYFSMSRIFLPRIRDILKNRNGKIDSDKTIADKIQSQIDEINNSTQKLRKTAAKQYKTSLDQSSKQAALKKEEGLQNLKLKIEEMVKNSKSEIENFKQQSQDDCKKVISNLVETINNKLLNQ